jgi:uncharacterized membrane protein
MRNQPMKVGVWLYGVATALTGILDIIWRDFDASHQPVKALGLNVSGQHILAGVAGVLLVAAGLAVLSRRTVKIGAATSAVVYFIFAMFWLFRCYAAIHALGWRMDVLAGTSFGVAQQIWLIAPTAIIYISAGSSDARLQRRAAISARWMLGLPAIVFGLVHLLGIHVFARIVPQWMPFTSFWAALTGVAFLLAGIAICSAITDLLAIRLLALMLLLFEGLVEIPPLFIRLHNQATWGAAVYNLTAIAACWIVAEFLVSRANRERTDYVENVTESRPDRVVA